MEHVNLRRLRRCPLRFTRQECDLRFPIFDERLVTTCNPDFNIAQTGIVGRWTPVKNLAFTADFNWSRLDQKYAGIWSGTAANIFAKPGGPVYEIKDQNSRTLLLRVQRNF
jgi:hypothetical protein